MKQSNTSHNEVAFSGILQPLVEMLDHSPRQGNNLVGQEVVFPDKEIRAIIALDAENNIHLLISPAGDDKRFSDLQLRGLKIINKEWAVAGFPVQNYLDISCSTGTMPSFKRPFLRFAEDVLYEILQSNISPSDAAYQTCMRWRRFWGPDSSMEVTSEWLHGIFGELLFLLSLIENFGPQAVQSWAGPLGSDHDFQADNELAVEVKSSTEIPFKIHCNIRQLDPAIAKKLYIACYRFTPSESGQKLPSLVKIIEQTLVNDGTILDKFYERLAAAGYVRQLEPVYNEFPVDHSEVGIFLVDDSFPKLIESSFTEAPDHRISNIRYALQLTGVNELAISDIINELELFGKK